MLGAIQLEWSLLGEPRGARSAASRSCSPSAPRSTAGAAGRGTRCRAHVGRVELAAFVLVPALLPLIFGGQTQSALGDRRSPTWPCCSLIYAVLGYGLVSILDWVVRRL